MSRASFAQAREAARGGGPLLAVWIYRATWPSEARPAVALDGALPLLLLLVESLKRVALDGVLLLLSLLLREL